MIVDKITNQEDVVETTQTAKPVQDIPMNILNTVQQGWQCPICGRILAPFITECPCKGRDLVQENISASYVPKNNVNLT